MMDVFDQHVVEILVIFTLLVTVPVSAHFVPIRVALALVVIIPQGRILFQTPGFTKKSEIFKYLLMHETMVLIAVAVTCLVRC